MRKSNTLESLVFKDRSRRNFSSGEITPFSPNVDWNFKKFDNYYKCLKNLGQGSQGVVTALENLLLPNKKVVAKFFKDTELNRKLVTNEIKILKRLNYNGCNPFILCYQEHFLTHFDNKTFCNLPYTEKDDIICVVYDYFLGNETVSLQKLLETLEKEESELDERFLVKLIETLLKSVAYLHNNSVAHLDLKPGNIVINLSTGRIQIIDFGIACLYDKVEKCDIGGTIQYMAPEIVKNLGKKEKSVFSVARKADSWSVGVMLFELVNTFLPFEISGNAIYYIGNLKQNQIKKSEYTNPYLADNVVENINSIINNLVLVDAHKRLEIIKIPLLG